MSHQHRWSPQGARHWRCDCGKWAWLNGKGVRIVLAATATAKRERSYQQDLAHEAQRELELDRADRGIAADPDYTEQL